MAVTLRDGLGTFTLWDAPGAVWRPPGRSVTLWEFCGKLRCQGLTLFCEPPETSGQPQGAAGVSRDALGRSGNLLEASGTLWDALGACWRHRCSCSRSGSESRTCCARHIRCGTRLQAMCRHSGIRVRCRAFPDTSWISWKPLAETQSDTLGRFGTFL